jgi:hypothetical protein
MVGVIRGKADFALTRRAYILQGWSKYFYLASGAWPSLGFDPGQQFRRAAAVGHALF